MRSDDATGPGPVPPVARVLRWAERARRYRGRERQAVLFVAKGTVAATAAWAVADDLIGASAPAFAPFSALLMLQVTIYRSLAQSLRYVLAVGAGVAVQGLLGFLAGPDLLTFALVTAVALAIGRSPRLGSQGDQVATAAFFAFSQFALAGGSAERLSHLAEIVLLVLLGCAIGVVANLLLFPPLRYQGSEEATDTLCGSLADLFADASRHLRDTGPDSAALREQRARAARLADTAGQARSALDTARESMFLNPARLRRRNRGRASFTGYRTVIDGLDRVRSLFASATRSLGRIADDEERPRPSPRFIGAFGSLLEVLAEATRTVAALDDGGLRARLAELDGLLADARAQNEVLGEEAEAGELGGIAHSHAYGTLLVDAVRMVEEFASIHTVLSEEGPAAR
jgi:hypothetical protein